MENLALGIVVILAFVSFLLFFCIIFIRLYFRKIKAYTQLIFQKEIDSQKAVNAAIIETQEQTLNNISQDLHDDAGQQLTSINFQIENLKLDSPEMKATLDPLSDSLVMLSQSIRSISHSLSNQLLLQQDLIKAIETETARLRNSSRLLIKLTTEKSEKVFSTSEKVIVYRIFQEITNNILKHSKASAIEIELKTQPFFAMTVSDNGKGFNSNQNATTLGLQSMAARAKIINYKFDIKSSPGNGTAVSLSEK